MTEPTELGCKYLALGMKNVRAAKDSDSTILALGLMNRASEDIRTAVATELRADGEPAIADRYVADGDAKLNSPSRLKIDDAFKRLSQCPRP